MMEQIFKDIDKLVESKTFNLDAIDGIKQIRDALVKAEKEVADYKHDLEMQNKQIGDLRVALANAERLADERKVTIDAMMATTEAGQKAIYDAQKHEAVANAWKEAMQTVFKPNTVRETVSRSIPMAINPGNGGASYVTSYGETSAITREEG